jgi:hypothetical protein
VSCRACGALSRRPGRLTATRVMVAISHAEGSRGFHVNPSYDSIKRDFCKGRGGFFEAEDSACFVAQSFHVQPTGIRMRTRTAFDVGVELALDVPTPDGEMSVSGVVVHCAPAADAPGLYDLIAYFGMVSPAQKQRLSRAAGYRAAARGW